jgi:hypothetical protein
LGSTHYIFFIYLRVPSCFSVDKQVLSISTTQRDHDYLKKKKSFFPF